MTKLFICGVCGRSIIEGELCNCPFCGAHKDKVYEYKASKNKWRCNVCNCEFDEKPDICPVCGAKADRIVEIHSNPNKQDTDFDNIAEVDLKNVQKALDVEVSNSTFYFSAAEKSDCVEEKYLFQSLGEVEREHAIIWQKVLNLKNLPTSDDMAHTSSLINLKESHSREDKAIKFYAEAANSSIDGRIKILFEALVEIETDHLKMSETRIDNFAK
ncbi:MAG: ferritin family protein [bacterium]